MADWLSQLSTYLGGDGSATSDGGFLGRASRNLAPQQQQQQQQAPQRLASMAQLFDKPVTGLPWVTPEMADAANNGPQDPNITMSGPVVAGGSVGQSPYDRLIAAGVDPRMIALSMMSAPATGGAGAGAAPSNGPGLVSKFRSLF